MSDLAACVAPKAEVWERVLSLLAARDYAEAGRILRCREDFSAREKAELLIDAVDRDLWEAENMVQFLLGSVHAVWSMKGAAVRWARRGFVKFTRELAWKNREVICRFLDLCQEAVDEGPGGYMRNLGTWRNLLDRMEGLSEQERLHILQEMQQIWKEHGFHREETHSRIRGGVAEYEQYAWEMDGRRLVECFFHPDGACLTTLGRTLAYHYWQANARVPSTLRGAWYDVGRPTIGRALRACAPEGPAVAGLLTAAQEWEHLRSVERRAAAAFYAGLAYFTARVRLFRYADLRLHPTPSEFAAHCYGPRPVVVLLEKEAHWVALAPLLRQHQASGLALGGAPSLITMEYFAAGLRRHVPRRADGLDLLLVTDYDPWGALIARRAAGLLAEHGLRLRSQVQVFSPRLLVEAGQLTPAEVVDAAYPLDLRGRPASYRSLVLNWMKASGGGVAGQFPQLNLPLDPPLSLSYDVLGTRRLLQVVRQHLHGGR